MKKSTNTDMMISTEELESIKKILQNPQVSAKVKKLEELLIQCGDKYFKVSDAEQILKNLVGGNWETKMQASYLFKGKLVGNIYMLVIFWGGEI
jgi:hypothetical protein